MSCANTIGDDDGDWSLLYQKWEPSDQLDACENELKRALNLLRTMKVQLNQLTESQEKIKLELTKAMALETLIRENMQCAEKLLQEWSAFVSVEPKISSCNKNVNGSSTTAETQLMPKNEQEQNFFEPSVKIEKTLWIKKLLQQKLRKAEPKFAEVASSDDFVETMPCNAENMREAGLNSDENDIVIGNAKHKKTKKPKKSNGIFDWQMFKRKKNVTIIISNVEDVPIEKEDGGEEFFAETEKQNENVKFKIVSLDGEACDDQNVIAEEVEQRSSPPEITLPENDNKIFPSESKSDSTLTISIRNEENGTEVEQTGTEQNLQPRYHSSNSKPNSVDCRINSEQNRSVFESFIFQTKYGNVVSYEQDLADGCTSFKLQSNPTESLINDKDQLPSSMLKLTSRPYESKCGPAEVIFKCNESSRYKLPYQSVSKLQRFSPVVEETCESNQPTTVASCSKISLTEIAPQMMPFVIEESYRQESYSSECEGIISSVLRL